MSEPQHLQDTIFALSSGRLPSGVAVVRISGPQVRFVLETILGKTIEPRYAAYKTFLTRAGDAIDKGLALFFPGPNSFTGEDCAEFHLHGGIAVVEKLLEELSTFPNSRMAEAGEFTRRAFTNGKMDLTIAEGLADLIAAETEGQRRLALQVASGAQRQLYTEWRQKLIRSRALIELMKAMYLVPFRGRYGSNSSLCKVKLPAILKAANEPPCCGMVCMSSLLVHPMPASRACSTSLPVGRSQLSRKRRVQHAICLKLNSISAASRSM
jgi:hypothetical protein